jgi:hypothetical protein
MTDYILCIYCKISSIISIRRKEKVTLSPGSQMTTINMTICPGLNVSVPPRFLC